MKPLIRGYILQAAFFIALGACALLIVKSHGAHALTANIIYSLTLTGMYGVSALYHCPIWSRRNYLLMRSIDHAAIFALIAGTATPICLLGLNNEPGRRLLFLLWGVAAIGMLLAIFWTQGPKWVRAFLYVAIGWLAVPYLPEIQSSLGPANTHLLLVGGVIYTVGALIYAIKHPDPFPLVFGYHEIFHILVVIASAFYFRVIYGLTT